MRRVKILYAEDDETLAFLTKDNLEQSGYEVTHCADGNLCMESFRKSEFDLCILDIMLPDGDGRELLTQLRSNEKTANIPVLMISAKYTAENIQHGAYKPNGFLAKPFDIDELLDKIEGILAGKVY